MASHYLSKASSYPGSSLEGFGGSSYGSSFGGESGAASGLGAFAGADKHTMQNLNDRLAVYLERVRALEASNSELELKIRQFYEKQAGERAAAKDYSKYYAIINDLRVKILGAIASNSRLTVQCDNARLAAQDFRLKYENELALCQNIKADIRGLHGALDDLNLCREDLKMQADSLAEELAFLKKNHEEEMHTARSVPAAQVNVKMEAAPGADLMKVLNDMRRDYEALAEKNRKDAEACFAQKSKELNQQIIAGEDQVQTSRSDISILRRTLQTLEIELRSQQALKKSLEDTLGETEGRYGAELQKLQLIIRGVEEQHLQIRSDMEFQSWEYKELLNIKTRLEMEIETYRHLLDGELGQFSSPENTSTVSSSSYSQAQTVTSASVEEKKEPSKTRRVKTFVEEMEDGKVMSSYVNEVEEEVNE